MLAMTANSHGELRIATSRGEYCNASKSSSTDMMMLGIPRPSAALEPVLLVGDHPSQRDERGPQDQRHSSGDPCGAWGNRVEVPFNHRAMDRGMEHRRIDERQ